MAERFSAQEIVGWATQRLSELDATISQLEKSNVLNRTGPLKGALLLDSELIKLCETREIFQAQIVAATHGIAWTDDQISEALMSIYRTWVKFEEQRDDYLDALGADLSTRCSVFEAGLNGRRTAWHKAIDELQGETLNLAAIQRASIEAHIEALASQVDEAQVGGGHLEGNFQGDLGKIKSSYTIAQRLLSDSYNSIKESIREATKSDLQRSIKR